MYWGLFLLFVGTAGIARSDIALLLEEPFGTFGGMNPTGHAAIYLNRVCAETPVLLRRCREDEIGTVISRYHRVSGYDWIAIPPIPYFYAVERPQDVPTSASIKEIAALRDEYRRKHLEAIAPDPPDGGTPEGDWTQLVGEAYDRSIYAFEIETTPEQDDELIRLLNSAGNQAQFNLLFRNCADFARKVMDFYYPKSIRRNFVSDLGVMTPRQVAKCLLRYSKRHPELRFSSFQIQQVPGPTPRSAPVRGVLEAIVKSKRYVIPLSPIALLHPAVGAGLVYAFLEREHFDPRKVAWDENVFVPSYIVREFRSN